MAGYRFGDSLSEICMSVLAFRELLIPFRDFLYLDILELRIDNNCIIYLFKSNIIFYIILFLSFATDVDIFFVLSNIPKI